MVTESLKISALHLPIQVTMGYRTVIKHERRQFIFQTMQSTLPALPSSFPRAWPLRILSLARMVSDSLLPVVIGQARLDQTSDPRSVFR